MVKIVCQHSGIEFEAATARTKQHPLVAALKKQSDKDGTYRAMNDALDSVRKVGGYATIEEYVQRVNDAMHGVPTAKAQARAYVDQRDEADRTRREQNAQLRAAGYVWHKYEAEHDAPEAGYEWELRSPDGRVVTVSQALDEIKRGIEVVTAEREAARIAAATAAREEAQRKADEEAAQDAEYKAFDSAAAELVKGLIECDRDGFNWDELQDREPVLKMRVIGASRYRAHDDVISGVYRGQRIVIVTTGSGYDDDGYPTIYAMLPEAAGLKRAEPNPAHRRLF